MFGLCMGYVWIMFGLCLGYVWVMFGLCLGYVWVMYGLCLGYVWVMFGLRLCPFVAVMFGSFCSGGSGLPAQLTPLSHYGLELWCCNGVAMLR